MSEQPLDEVELASIRPSKRVQRLGGRRIAGVPPEVDLSWCDEVDFGPLRVKVPPEAQLRMSREDEVYSDAVFFDFPDGKIRLSVLAAPRSGRLWPERAEEIATSQARLGAQVSSVWGQWGRELHIADNGERNWVIGVDGSRCMLLGRATWPADNDPDLVETMRAMVRSSVVVRGTDPLPVRAPLALRRPGAVEDEATERESPYSVPVQLVPASSVTTAADEATTPATPAEPAVGRLRRARPEWPRAVFVAAAATVLLAGVIGVLLGVRAAAPEKPISAMPPATAPQVPFRDDASPTRPAPAVPSAPTTVPARTPPATQPGAGRAGRGMTQPAATPAPAASRAAGTGQPSRVAAEDTRRPSSSSRSAGRGDHDAPERADRDDDPRNDETPEQSGPLGALSDGLLRVLPGIG